MHRLLYLLSSLLLWTLLAFAKTARIGTPRRQ